MGQYPSNALWIWPSIIMRPCLLVKTKETKLSVCDKNYHKNKKKVQEGEEFAEQCIKVITKNALIHLTKVHSLPSKVPSLEHNVSVLVLKCRVRGFAGVVLPDGQKMQVPWRDAGWCWDRYRHLDNRGT